MTTIKLHHRPRKKSLLVIGVILLISSLAYTILFPPENFWLIGIFILLLAAGIFYAADFILVSRRRALLITIGLTLVLILRAMDLKHWLYPLLIVALIVTIEAYSIRK